MDSYFRTNMGYMCSGRIVGDMALFCDLVVIQPLTDQLCDLCLTGCQVKALLDIIPLS
jgi:hypothetical protein